MSQVVFIGAGPGDPELITLKGKKWLEKADVVIYTGSLLNPQILKYCKPSAELYDSAKMNLQEVLKVMVEAVKAGKLVARVHDGDPSIYGAIQEQIDFLDKENITYFRVPGVSCLQGAAASLNRELTLPNISQTVIITRPEGRTPMPEGESLTALAKHQATMVIFLGTLHIAQVVADLQKGGYPKDTPAAVVYKATWPEQQIVKGTLNDIVEKVKAAGITQTALIFVGKVFNPEEYDFSKLYDAAFTTGFRKGA
ncbi:precorrin-4 C(11)-methyltransferase [Candidatus Bathyarchaeota archaeon A05DMB-2]|jgi:precorrin-4/cobalt-precorrin-4 C11-methyltransferase|nr:precorrin-4 C(11)-methyltransferase [Candidatus Bathyarchaeota archaeon A05DMB-2]